MTSGGKTYRYNSVQQKKQKRGGWWCYSLEVPLEFLMKCAIRFEASRELFRPIPIHFSKWGAKREAASVREQLGQTHSSFLIPFNECPNISTLELSKQKKQSLRIGKVACGASWLPYHIVSLDAHCNTDMRVISKQEYSKRSKFTFFSLH